MKYLTLASLMIIFLNINTTRENELSLKSAFTAAFKVGMAVNDDIVSGEASTLQKIVVQQTNSVTLEISMKAEIITPI